MKEAWLIGAFAAVLSSVPPHLRNTLEPREGGLQSPQTHALPIILGEKQFVVISFYKSDGPVYKKPLKIYPPFASVSVSYPNKEVKWSDVTPTSFGLINLPITESNTPYLGVLEQNGTSSIREWRNADARYDQLISLVLERRWLLTRQAVTPEEQATARELQECTRILYDKPLLPYYRHVGRHFLGWMERAAK